MHTTTDNDREVLRAVAAGDRSPRALHFGILLDIIAGTPDPSSHGDLSTWCRTHGRGLPDFRVRAAVARLLDDL